MKKAVIHDKRIDLSEIKKLIIQGDTIDSVAFLVPRYYNNIDLADYSIYLKYENDVGQGEDLLLTQSKVTDTVITLLWEAVSPKTAGNIKSSFGAPTLRTEKQS